MAVRLQKYLAECGVSSRRKCEELIVARRVRVNGALAALGQTVDPSTDQIEVDGSPVERDRKVYVLLHKPAGVVTTVTDTHKRPTVLDCLKPETCVSANPISIEAIALRLFPVGRLDLDTRGVLLLTNDGELANRLMHPRYGIDKVYLARVDGVIKSAAIRKLESGVELDDGRTAPARVEVIGAGPVTSRIRITLREGRKREVKRMCAKVGFPVIDLERESMAGLGTKGLRPGEWRPLKEAELQMLRTQTGLIGPINAESKSGRRSK
jgi:pseudouridine synthase